MQGIIVNYRIAVQSRQRLAMPVRSYSFDSFSSNAAILGQCARHSMLRNEIEAKKSIKKFYKISIHSHYKPVKSMATAKCICVPCRI